jgi:prevent-host-death family protein
MKIASIADVKAHFSNYIRASQEELIVITRNGKPTAVLLPIEDEEELERLVLTYSKRFQAVLAEAREQIKTTGGSTHAEFWQKIENST